jgi:uncharacterized protein
MSNKKNTLIIGASNNPSRYSFKAAHALQNKSFSFILFGVKRGDILGQPILNSWDNNWEIDTVTLYINSVLQEEYYTKIIHLKPRRVIFNPGTENPEFQDILTKNNIAHENSCTLVLLSMGVF